MFDFTSTTPALPPSDQHAPRNAVPRLCRARDLSLSCLGFCSVVTRFNNDESLPLRYFTWSFGASLTIDQLISGFGVSSVE